MGWSGVDGFCPSLSTGHLILAGRCWGLTMQGQGIRHCHPDGRDLCGDPAYWANIRSTLVALPPNVRRSGLRSTFHRPSSPPWCWGCCLRPSRHTCSRRVVVASTFIIGGFIILWAERRPPSATRIHSGRDDAAGCPQVGLVQCLAMIPGTSRSGATIIGGMLLGLSRQAATDFSFFWPFPPDRGRGVQPRLQGARAARRPTFRCLPRGWCSPSSAPGCVLRWLLRYISSHSFVPFAYYRIVFGVIVLDCVDRLVQWPTDNRAMRFTTGRVSAS